MKKSREVTDSESQRFILQIIQFTISLRYNLLGSLKGFNFASIQGICGELKEKPPAYGIANNQLLLATLLQHAFFFLTLANLKLLVIFRLP